MKALQLVLCTLSVLLLAACANTWAGLTTDAKGPHGEPANRTNTTYEGVKKDARDFSNWAHGAPSNLGNAIGTPPTAYAGQGTVRYQQPDNTQRPALNQKQRPNFPHMWKDIGQLHTMDQASPAETEQLQMPQSLLPQKSSSIQRGTRTGAVEYDRNISVFPVDGDASPYPQMNDKGVVMFNGNSSAGRLVQKMFFGYGSSRIGVLDRKNLQKLAKKLQYYHSEYKVDVVGHASKRVDNVDDPAQIRLINFTMAQKRADAVTHALDNVGVDPDRVATISRGDEVPNPDRDGRTQEAADRRVEIYVDSN